ncbi:DeoR/GlpR family DNA-binding transcription regulator [Caldilinea sp.]|uniref:DeoR/GlpR family DNA-binding transcription regulator n=1 Tax=Caldilinea sp. TaxID=2293560 RepID=UPI002BED1018|nr:DeoR/GlpR transcriptional regulator [Anaerolineales bacterium]HQY91266.1 DeoR/GlpR family DNA-binding transcription regulator [Caldilinea sp.]HRA66735.1 DeoR/GlpR family DNA-binding transcription regulator [Caldilinea sp.]
MNEIVAEPAPERQRLLLAWIERRQRVTVPEITERFAVSPATARRDLETLAGEGKVQRVHGGAIAVRRAPPEPPVLQRSLQQAEEKQRIAALAAELVGDGETIFLSSGTTVMEVAHLLRERQNLTVLTNSLLVINALADAPNVEVIVLGGVVRASESSLVGALTLRSLAELRAVKVIFGIRAIDLEQGLTNNSLEESLIDREILRLGSEIIIVADHTKFGRVSTVFISGLEMIDTLVTDAGAPVEMVQALREQGIDVRIA